MKIVQTNLDGSTTLIDLRVFSIVKQNQIKAIKDRAMELILKKVPEYKQINAALGLLSNEETDKIKQDIQNIRILSDQKENQIESIVWDGNKETEAAACDAVELIYLD
jgi:hypothetical protein